MLAAGLAFRSDAQSPRSYEDLTRLFEEWRAFQKPAVTNGVPDYTPAAIGRQRQALPGFQKRLAALDTTGWSIAQKVDRQLVRAEMNGLEFDHRLLRPWSRNPCFYAVIFTSQADVPAREGPVALGAIELWQYTFPLPPAQLADLRTRLRAIPPLLDQAKTNLVEDARDLWFLGIKVKARESQALAALETRLRTLHPDLAPDAARAKQAVDAFRVWLEARLPLKKAASGVGVANYDWYMRNVHLSPLTWADERAVMERELGRATAQLKLEEQRNRALRPLLGIASAEEYHRRFGEAVTEFMAFLREREIMTIAPSMDSSLREREGGYAPPEARDFFAQVDFRDPLVMRCHGTHWFDLARMRETPHASPVRRGPLLYNIWDARAEGLATAMEEMMMTAGLLDSRPRSRELVHILVANRAARGLAGHFVHDGSFALDDAVRFAHQKTPYGWLKQDGATMWAEQQLYLEQPGYGTSYLIGKAQIEKLIGDRARQLSDRFSLRSFFDEFHTSGMIPVSMIHWEMTGQDDEVRRLGIPP